MQGSELKGQAKISFQAKKNLIRPLAGLLFFPLMKNLAKKGLGGRKL